MVRILPREFLRKFHLESFQELLGGCARRALGDCGDRSLGVVDYLPVENCLETYFAEVSLPARREKRERERERRGSDTHHKPQTVHTSPKQRKE